MKKVVASGVLIIVGVEVLALLLHDRRLVLWTSGAAAAIAMFYVRSFVGRDIEPPVAEPGSDLFGDSLRSWLSRTETMIRWSESTRSDWDRHLRPILARRFEIATGQRQAKDPLHSTPPARCSSAGTVGLGESQQHRTGRGPTARPGPGHA
ncbi:hypothetical protein I553_6772 [Mycobacterium xenopi 4042]|uniref:Uncharacterized protein n=1 Tax=Mycobacterium xenopi 4042 TaxID=1299334 RepID=X7Z4D4_MYCXE|nr:hypothetical protein I553_6772 [Mycobacterium xenopi 4042]